MKKSYKLEGLDCANCAAKIEEGIKCIEGVKNVSVNFITTKLVIEADDDIMDDIIKASKEIINRLEPDVEMVKA